MSKRKEEKQKKDWNKILQRVLLICTILCFILVVLLYISGIRKVLPMILIFALSMLSCLVIFLTSRNILLMKKEKEKIIAKNHV